MIMPRLRYGPDVTDDAASLLTDLDRIDKKLKQTQSAAARARLVKQRDLINRGIKEVFGSRQNARTLAKESLARQGYADPADVKALGGKRFKKLKGKGQLNLAATPGRNREAIPRKKGYQARPETANPELYKSAQKKAAQAQSILRQVRSQETAGKAAKKKAKAAAKKVSAAKKAAPAKKAAAPKKAAKKAVAAKKAAKKVATPKKTVKKVTTPKKVVKKATPKKKR